jgi:membrane protease YdiL (CAAX protease family)
MPTNIMSRTDAILLACATFVLPSIADGVYKELLFRISPGLFWFGDFCKFVLIPAVALVWLRARANVGPSGYGLRRRGRNESRALLLGTILLSTLLLGAVYQIGLRYGWVLFRPTPPTFMYANAAPDGWRHWPVVLYFALTAGFVEEVFARGLTLLYFEERFGRSFPHAGYVIGTALVFGLFHWENGIHEILATFAFGLLAAALYLHLRNLWPLIAAHVLLDLWLFA